MADRSRATISEFPPEALCTLDDPDENMNEDRAPRAPQMQRLGRYRLVREIASGGMASVNLAVADGVDKLVALKMIHAHLAQEESFVQMFLDEARIASAISHRNVCNVFDFGEVDGRYFLAMDYLSGQSLRDVIHRLRKVPDLAPAERLSVFAATIIGEACEGLHAAHELRDAQGKPLDVVHRDVSPHNLFVSYDGSVSVVDFGIARAADRIQHTATGVLKGKFSYMAPEQIRQLETDRKADVWALGVCLWETLTLQRLFVRSSQADTLMSVMMDRVKAPSEVYPGIPPALDNIVMRALARSPAQRYATARELGRDLAKFVRDSGEAMDSVEIEQWLARLFPAEIEENRRLLRNARLASMEESQLLEGTSSTLARTPTRSGAMLRARASMTPSNPGDSASTHRLLLDAAPDNDISASQQAQMAPSQIVAHDNKRNNHKLLALVLALGMGAIGGYAALKPQPVPVMASAPSKVAPIAPVTTAPAPVTSVGALPVEPQLEPATEVTAPIALRPSENVDPVSLATVQNRESGAMPSVLDSKPQLTHGAARSASARRATVPNPERAAAVETASAPTVPAQNQPVPGDAVVPAADASASDALRAASTPPVQAKAEAAVATPPVAPAPVKAPTIVAPLKLDALSSITDIQVDGSLGTGVVGRMLSRAEPLLRRCYVDAAKRSGRNQFVPISMALTIDEMGAVRRIEPGKHPLSGLSDCVASELKRLRSERKPDVGTVHVRFSTEFKAP